MPYRFSEKRMEEYDKRRTADASPRGETCYVQIHTDTEMLEWLLHHVSGKELRDIGLDFSWTGDRDETRRLIDEKLGT